MLQELQLCSRSCSCGEELQPCSRSCSCAPGTAAVERSCCCAPGAAAVLQELQLWRPLQRWIITDCPEKGDRVREEWCILRKLRGARWRLPRLWIITDCPERGDRVRDEWCILRVLRRARWRLLRQWIITDCPASGDRVQEEWCILGTLRRARWWLLRRWIVTSQHKETEGEKSGASCARFAERDGNSSNAHPAKCLAAASHSKATDGARLFQEDPVLRRQLGRTLPAPSCWHRRMG